MIPLPKPQVVSGAPTTIQEARAGGAVVGTILAAPLAPASGPIDVPKPVATTDDMIGREPLVVVTVKAFWQSATIKALRNAVLTALGIALGIVAAQIIVAQGDIWEINWQTTEKAAIAAAAFSLASGYAAWWRAKDNNAVHQ
jgi:hypothetical protein